MTRPRYLLMNGALVAYEDARVHVLSSAFKYAAMVFEGFRAYRAAPGSQLLAFRLRDHFERLVRSMKVARIVLPLGPAELEEQLLSLIRANGFHEDVHMRAQVYVDEEDGKIGATGPVSYALASVPMGSYFARDGVNVQVSSWTRTSEADLPPRVKASANYHNSRLALLQARADGYDDAILLAPNGKVSEGPGYNVFVVRDGILLTPPCTDGVLEGITRDSLIRIAVDMGIRVEQRSIDRTELYVADEMFFCGSAAEVTPILSVDRHAVGSGVPGQVSVSLKRRYLQIARGETSDPYGWTTAVYPSPASDATIKEVAATRQ